MMDIIIINMECSDFLLSNPVLFPGTISLLDSGDHSITIHPSTSGLVNKAEANHTRMQ